MKLRIDINPSGHGYILFTDSLSAKIITKWLLGIVKDEVGDLESEEACALLGILRDRVCKILEVNSLSAIGSK